MFAESNDLIQPASDKLPNLKLVTDGQYIILGGRANNHTFEPTAVECRTSIVVEDAPQDALFVTVSLPQWHVEYDNGDHHVRVVSINAWWDSAGSPATKPRLDFQFTFNDDHKNQKMIASFTWSAMFYGKLNP